jgi:hypothetical protein
MPARFRFIPLEMCDYEVVNHIQESRGTYVRDEYWYKLNRGVFHISKNEDVAIYVVDSKVIKEE